jgi:putative ABC transport system permease protein
VVVLGDGVKEQLFGGSEAIGRVIMLGEVPFTVVGVMLAKTQNSSYNRRDKDRVFIPASTFSSIYGVRYVNNIIYRPHDPTKWEEVGEKVRQVLAERYTFDAADKDAIWIWDTSEMDKFFFYFFLSFNIFLGLIGSFTLAVGGIGVANIMYIVVQERIREIGVRRAVGAKRSNILFQFFLETIFIVGLGRLPDRRRHHGGPGVHPHQGVRRHARDLDRGGDRHDGAPLRNRAHRRAPAGEARRKPGHRRVPEDLTCGVNC